MKTEISKLFFPQLARRGQGQGEMEPGETLYPQSRRKTEPLPHGSGAEALWELSSRAGAAPSPPAPPSRTHLPTCCLIYPKISMLKPCHGPFWRQLVTECLAGIESMYRAGAVGLGRVRSAGHPPPLAGCQGWRRSRRRWVLPWLSPQDTPRRSSAHDANPELPTSPQRSS